MSRPWTLNHVLRGAAIALCISATGCSAAFYGIKPDQNDFRRESSAYCKSLPGDHKEISACIEYEDTVRRASALENAYLTLERVNRWGIFVGATIALASVGALTGLYAFGEAASDAAKIIPIAGTFVGSVIAYLSNEVKADAYEDARFDLRHARVEAEAKILPASGVGRDVSKYNAAQSELNKKIYDIELKLSESIRAGRPSTAELVKKSETLMKDNLSLTFVNRYHVEIVNADESKNPVEMTITLTTPLTSGDEKFLADNGTVRIDEIDQKLNGAAIKGDKITVSLPDTIKNKLNKSHALYIKLGNHELTPVKSFSLH